MRSRRVPPGQSASQWCKSSSPQVFGFDNGGWKCQNLSKNFGGILVSANNGTNWTAVNSGLTDFLSAFHPSGASKRRSTGYNAKIIC